MGERDTSTLLLFDVDGTITESRQVYCRICLHCKQVQECIFCLQVISDVMKEFMTRLRERYIVGLVGGSDLVKVQEQMGGDDG